MNRKLLLAGITALAAAAVLLLAVPFAGSLRPNERARASLPAIDVSTLQPGRLELRDHPVHRDLYGGFRWSVLFLKHADGTLSAWDVPTIEGRIGMPDIHWWRPFYACAAFGLVTASGEAPYLACQDPDLPAESWRQEWQWTLQGKRRGKSTDDMQATRGVLEGQLFIVGRRE